MPPYSRQQLWLILLLAGAAGAGLAIEHWRQASPELAERLEALDRVERREIAPPPPRAAGRRPRPAAPAAPLDVNAATEAELARLPGVGPSLAARIVAARPFAEVEDLRRVRGLRRATLERLRPLLAVADEGR